MAISSAVIATCQAENAGLGADATEATVAIEVGVATEAVVEVAVAAAGGDQPLQPALRRIHIMQSSILKTLAVISLMATAAPAVAQDPIPTPLAEKWAQLEAALAEDRQLNYRLPDSEANLIPSTSAASTSSNTHLAVINRSNPL